VSQHTPLSATVPRNLEGLPVFRGREQRYGALSFANGVEMPMVLDAALDGYRLYVDRNLNGDLGDDGPGYTNQGTGLFATLVPLPLSLVTGREAWDGEYVLWLYTGGKERPPASMRFYARTQLQGEVALPAGRFDVFLADNGPSDGDFSNDGIAVDLDRDGRIDLQEEFFEPGRNVVVDGARYRFVVRP
jgi:hypothetical protein